MEHGVEVVVAGGLARLGRERHLLHDVAQHHQLLLGRTSSGKRGAQPLDRRPSLGDLDGLVHRERFHPSTFMWLELDEAFECELLQGQTDGRSRRSEMLAELGLHEPLPGSK